MRHKPYARPELEAWPHFCATPPDNKNRWNTAFANPTLPLRLELGCGKGGFLARHALQNPGFNYLGVDIKNEVLVVAKRNIEQLYAAAEREIDNVLLAGHGIEQIEEMLGEQDVFERIYINFCNPWPKKGDAKHRLTHPRVLVKCRDYLPDGAKVYFKTDDDALFEDSLRYFPMSGYAVTWQTRDLHAAEPDWNIRTEHEDMFAADGIPIKACIAEKQPAQLDKSAFLRLKDV